MIEASPLDTIAGVNVSNRCTFSGDFGLARGGSGGGEGGSNISIFLGVLLTGVELVWRGGTAAFGAWAWGALLGISAIGLGISPRGFGASTFGFGTSFLETSALETSALGAAAFGVSVLGACAWGISTFRMLSGVATLALVSVSGTDAVSTRGWRRGKDAADGRGLAAASGLAAGLAAG